MSSPYKVGIIVVGSQVFVGMKYAGALPDVGSKTGRIRISQASRTIVEIDVYNKYNDTVKGIAIGVAQAGSYISEASYVYEYIPNAKDRVFRVEYVTMYGSFTSNVLNNYTNRFDFAKKVLLDTSDQATSIFVDASEVLTPGTLCTCAGAGSQESDGQTLIGGTGNQAPPESGKISITNVSVSGDGLYYTGVQIAVAIEFSDLVKIVGHDGRDVDPGFVSFLYLDIRIGDKMRRMTGASISDKIIGGGKKVSVLHLRYLITSDDYDDDGIEIYSPLKEHPFIRLVDYQYPARNLEVVKSFQVPKRSIRVNVNQSNTVAKLISARDYLDPLFQQATTGAKYYVELTFDKNTYINNSSSITIMMDDMSTRTLSHTLNADRQTWLEPRDKHVYEYIIQDSDGPNIRPISVTELTPTNAILTSVSASPVDLSSLPLSLSRNIVFNPQQQQRVPVVKNIYLNRPDTDEVVSTLPYDIYLDVEFFDEIEVHNGNDGQITLSFYMVADKYTYRHIPSGNETSVEKLIVVGTNQTPTHTTPFLLEAKFDRVLQDNKTVRFVFTINDELLRRTLYDFLPNPSDYILTNIHLLYVQFGYIHYKSSTSSITLSGGDVPFNTSQRLKNYFTENSLVYFWSTSNNNTVTGFWIQKSLEVVPFSIYVRPIKIDNTRTSKSPDGKFLQSNGSFMLSQYQRDKERDYDAIAMFLVFKDAMAGQVTDCDPITSIRRGEGSPPYIETSIGRFVMPESNYFLQDQDTGENSNTTFKPPKYRDVVCWMFVRKLIDEDDLNIPSLRNALTINSGIHFGNNSVINEKINVNSLTNISNLPVLLDDGDITITPSTSLAAYQLTSVPADSNYDFGDTLVFTLTKPTLSDEDKNPLMIFGTNETRLPLLPRRNQKVYMPLLLREIDSSDDVIRYIGIAFAEGTINLEDNNTQMPTSINLYYRIPLRSSLPEDYSILPQFQIDVWPVLLYSLGNQTLRPFYSTIFFDLQQGYIEDFERPVFIGSHTVLLYRKDWSCVYQNRPIRILSGVRFGGTPGTSSNKTRPMWVDTYVDSSAKIVYKDPNIQQYDQYIYNPSALKATDEDKILKIFVVFDRPVTVIGSPKLDVVLYDTQYGKPKPFAVQADYYGTSEDGKTVQFNLVAKSSEYACSTHNIHGPRPLTFGSLIFDQDNKIVDANDTSVCASPFNPAATHIVLNASSAWNAVKSGKHMPKHYWYSNAYAPRMKDKIYDVVINEHVVSGGLKCVGMSTSLSSIVPPPFITAGTLAYIFFVGDKKYELVPTGDTPPTLAIATCQVNYLRATYVGSRERDSQTNYYIFALNVPHNFPRWAATAESMIYPFGYNRKLLGGALIDKELGLSFIRIDAARGSRDEWDIESLRSYRFDNREYPNQRENLYAVRYRISPTGEYTKLDLDYERVFIEIEYSHPVAVVQYRETPDVGADNVYVVGDRYHPLWRDWFPKLAIPTHRVWAPDLRPVPVPLYFYYVEGQFREKIKFAFPFSELERAAQIMGIPVTGTWHIASLKHRIEGRHIVSLRGTKLDELPHVYIYNGSLYDEQVSASIVINIE